jgi:hypothetical protein
MAPRILRCVAAGAIPLVVLSLALSAVSVGAGMAGRTAIAAPAPTNPTTWVNDTGPQPPFEQGAPMAYDPQSHQVILVTTNSTKFACVMYTWSYTNGTWRNQTGSTSGEPAVTQHAGFVFDASDGYMLLYGGWDNCNSGYAATWAYHNSTWTQIVTVGHPTAGIDFGMVYDAHDGYVLLYGGFKTSAGVSHQTWAYHAGVWSQVKTKRTPNAGVYVQLASNPVSGGVLLFGGGLGGRTGNLTWTYQSGVWSPVMTTSTPPATSDGVFEFSPRLGYILFGGFQLHPGYENFTWIDTNGTWRNVTSSLSASPPIVLVGYDSAAFDAASGHLVVFLSPNTAGTAMQTWSLV